MSQKRAEKERRRAEKNKIKKQKAQGHYPCGVLYCEEEKKPVGYVRIHIQDKKGQKCVKEKAKAAFWKGEAKWAKGYEPGEDILNQMRDGNVAICPKCKGRSSFIVMWNVKYVDNVNKELGLTEEAVLEHANRDALNTFDKLFFEALTQKIKEMTKDLDWDEIEEQRTTIKHAFDLELEARNASEYVEEQWLQRFDKLIDRYIEVSRRLAKRADFREANKNNNSQEFPAPQEPETQSG